METRNPFDTRAKSRLGSSSDIPLRNESGSMEKPRSDARKANAVRAVGLAATAILAISLVFAGYSLAFGGKAASEDQRSPLTETLLGGMESGSGPIAGSEAIGPAGEYPYCAPPYDDLGTEEYASLDEPGFVSAERNPLSTLSADVDTASYCNLRRMVADGIPASSIPAGAIRTEELLNYFDYDYAPPSGKDLFGITARAGVCPWNAETILLVLGFSTDARDASNPNGSNLVFLIDTSGSMGDLDKLPLVKDAFATLADQLDEHDRVSIVTYSKSENVLLEGASGTDKARIMSAVNSLAANGSTNGGAGLATAYDIARRNFIEGGVNRIVMASDGDLNVGMTSESELRDFVERQREGGVYLSVLGFGSGNYKDTKMETIADCGNGAYHYIDCAEEARRVLDEDLRSNFVPLADDVKVQVEFNPAQIKGYRLIGYENRTLAAEDFEDDAVDAGEVGAEHQFTVAYEVVPVGSPFEVDAPELKYEHPNGEEAPDSAIGRSWRDAESDGTAFGEKVGGEYSANPMSDSAADGRTESIGGMTASGTQAATKTKEAGATKASLPGSIADEWLTCSIRYKPAEREGCAEQQTVVDASAFSRDPGCDWEFAAAVIECSMLLRQSDYAGSATYDEALGLISPTDEGREEFSMIVRKLRGPLL